YLPPTKSDGPRVGIYDGQGELAAVVPLPEEATEHAVATTVVGTVTWWTGSSVVAFNSSDLEPRWSLPETRGPATAMANELLIPVPTGLAIINPATGLAERTIGVTRPHSETAIIPGVIGNVVVEQRGDIVVALR
ncbi:MAG: hypothetical protein GX542_09075, partial [Rhodococcus sp.]|nr:hypothetical protein [Rhodococcus sp. (in: high G+C Gram-positive bacteria)]